MSLAWNRENVLGMSMEVVHESYVFLSVSVVAVDFCPPIFIRVTRMVESMPSP